MTYSKNKKYIEWIKSNPEVNIGSYLNAFQKVEKKNKQKKIGDFIC